MSGKEITPMGGGGIGNEHPMEIAEDKPKIKEVVVGLVAETRGGTLPINPHASNPLMDMVVPDSDSEGNESPHNPIIRKTPRRIQRMTKKEGV